MEASASQQWISVPLSSGTDEMPALLVAPEGRSKGTIVMLQEIFGVNEAMQQKAQDFAAPGYTVLLPDLFWRQKPKLALGYSEEERKAAFGYMQQYDQLSGADDIRDAIAFMRRRDPERRKVAVVGFCLGGRMAVLASSNNDDVASVVSFYGVRLDLCEEQLRLLRAPFQLHVGDKDAHVPREHVDAVKRTAQAMRDAEVFVYPGAGHGFFNRARSEVFDPAAAALGMRRAISLLQRSA
jgi:carboxymethylenebutenolidase